MRRLRNEIEARQKFGNPSRSGWNRLRAAGLVPQPVKLGHLNMYDDEELDEAAEKLRLARDEKLAGAAAGAAPKAA
jgi:hypothetical protein